MLSQRQRPWLITLLVILGIWLLALGGYWLATQKKVTLEKLVARLHSTDLSGQNPSDRAKSLAELARMLNALPYGERRTARMDEEWNRLFKQMNDAEKGDFLDATLPNGFKQMLTAFEQLPEDKRQKAISDATKRIRDARAAEGSGKEPDGSSGRPDRPADLSPELQQKFVKKGLEAYYRDSSAQTKAELAPFMEELQKSMESGRLFRR